MDNIEEGFTVFIRRGKVLKAFKLQKGKKIVFEKLHFTPDKAFGQPFNSHFRVVSNELVKVDVESAVPKVEKDEDDAIVHVEDNRLLVDSYGKSQSLCREEIVGMKSSGAADSEIISEIVKNSATFTSKTTYSQKKYLKKKRNKHMTNVQILRPSARLLCQMYENREPAKICQMRANTFAQVLTMSNIRHGSKVVVVENCSGVLLSLLMERLGGSGCIVNLHTGETPTNLHAASLMNFSDETWSILHSLPLCKIGPVLAGKEFSPVAVDIAEFQTAEAATPSSDFDNLAALKEKSKKGTELTEDEKGQIRFERRRKRFFHQKSAWDVMHARDMDALILACRYHPSPILLSLLEVLGPSRPFVVHCEYQEPLMELFCQLMNAGKAVNLKISDTFTRAYQVLPERTHPLVTMNTSGGYLLTGIKVDVTDARSKLHGIHEKSDNEIPLKKTKLC